MGHLTLINLQQLVEPIFTGFTDTTNPWDVPTNADIADRTRQQRGVVSYTHPANNPDDWIMWKCKSPPRARCIRRLSKAINLQLGSSAEKDSCGAN